MAKRRLWVGGFAMLALAMTNANLTMAGEPGHPGQEPGHPGQEPGHPGQEPGHPGQEPGHPGQEPGHPGSNYPDFRNYFRIDCRFHNVERNPGVNFCYASAVYRPFGEELRNVHLGVGCDNLTLYNDKGRVQVETTLDRISPFNAATPAIEVFPQGQLITEGTYTSELDIWAGRLIGLCYVHRVSETME